MGQTNARPPAEWLERNRHLERENAELRRQLRDEQLRVTLAQKRAELAEQTLRATGRIAAGTRPPAAPASGPCRVLVANRRAAE